MDMKGYVYILSNKSMPGLLKIGKTTTSPAQRMAELHSTGVPTPFELELAVEVSDCDVSEREVHALLDTKRVMTHREFFRISVRKAIDQILSILGDYKIVDVRESHGIEEIEASLENRRKEAESLRMLREVERARHDREQERECVVRLRDLREKLARARGRLDALGPRPVRRELSGLATFLMLCWLPIPGIGWTVWGGSLLVFGRTGQGVGYVCIALLIGGFFTTRQCKKNRADYAKEIGPFENMDGEIQALEEAISAIEALRPAPPAPPNLQPVPKRLRETRTTARALEASTVPPRYPHPLPDGAADAQAAARVSQANRSSGCPKIIVRCPTCENLMRLPANKKLDATCPHCRVVFRTTT